MSVGEAVRSVFRDWSDFSGRASRLEYWLFNLALVGLYLLSWVAIALSRSSALVWVLIALYLVLLVPTLAVFVRRLHDVGRSGWWWLIAFIPLGSFVLLVFLLLDSTPGPNAFGPPPRGSSYEHPSTWRQYGYGAPAGWGTSAGPQPGWGAPTQPSAPSPWDGQPSPPSPPPGPPAGWGQPGWPPPGPGSGGGPAAPVTPRPAWQETQQRAWAPLPPAAVPDPSAWAPPPPPPAAAPGPSPWAPPTARPCPACGQPATTDATFCSRCGRPLPAA